MIIQAGPNQWIEIEDGTDESVKCAEEALHKATTEYHRQYVCKLWRAELTKARGFTGDALREDSTKKDSISDSSG